MWSRLAVVLVIASLGCGPHVAADGGDSSTSTSDDSGTSGGESSTETGSSATSMMFVPDESSCGGSDGTPDDEWGFYCTFRCSVLHQNCPDGEKCVPYGSTGEGVFDASKCVVVLGDVPAGQPCTYDGVTESTDDCDQSSFCFASTEGGPGLCRPFCEPPGNAPLCPEGSACAGSEQQPDLVLCLPICAQASDCGEGEGCYLWSSDPLLCMPAGILAAGEPCGAPSECAAGNLCYAGELVLGCADASCCTPLCSVADALACDAIPGSECVALFDPPDDRGVCIDPGAMP